MDTYADADAHEHARGDTDVRAKGEGEGRGRTLLAGPGTDEGDARRPLPHGKHNGEGGLPPSPFNFGVAMPSTGHLPEIGHPCSFCAAKRFFAAS